MQGFAIVVITILCSVFYGILHDQVTVRICIEYFTIGHPPVFDTDSPTLLALGWGVIATWWMGLILGVPLAITARGGSRTKRTALSLVRPLAILLAAMGLLALLAGIIGAALARTGAVFLLEPLASRVPEEVHVSYLGVLWAHSASYLVGFLGAVVLMVLVWRSRKSSLQEADA